MVMGAVEKNMVHSLWHTMHGVECRTAGRFETHPGAEACKIYFRLHPLVFAARGALDFGEPFGVGPVGIWPDPALSDHTWVRGMQVGFLYVRGPLQEGHETLGQSSWPGGSDTPLHRRSLARLASGHCQHSCTGRPHQNRLGYESGRQVPLSLLCRARVAGHRMSTGPGALPW